MSQNPYQPPMYTGARPESGTDVSDQYIYRPLGRVAALIMGFMFLLCFLFLMVATMETVGTLMFPTFADFDAPIQDGLETILVSTEAVIAVLTIPIYFLMIVLVCVFMYRANANVRALGATGLRFTPGFCGGFWFIPIISLYRPYQAMKEIYQCSCNPTGNLWKTVEPFGVLPFWWAAWLIGGFLGRIASRMALRGIDPGAWGLPLTWSSAILTIIAGMLLITITGTISKLQGEAAGKDQDNQQFDLSNRERELYRDE